MSYDVRLKLFGEIAAFDGQEYALIRKISAVSDDPDFPDMLCVPLRPIKLVALAHLGPGVNNCGECEMPSRSRIWETSSGYLKDFLETDDSRNVLW